MANEMQMVLGSPTTVISHAATLAASAYTYSGLTGLTMTVLDNSTQLYPFAKATLTVTDTLGAVPAAQLPVSLWMLRGAIDGAIDMSPPPDATALKSAVFVGNFVISPYDDVIRNEITISLAGVTKAWFFIKNELGVTLVSATNPITVKITPFTYGPA